MIPFGAQDSESSVKPDIHPHGERRFLSKSSSQKPLLTERLYKNLFLCLCRRFPIKRFERIEPAVLDRFGGTAVARLSPNPESNNRFGIPFYFPEANAAMLGTETLTPTP